MANQFGERLKQLREQNKLLQRQVASLLEIDTPMLSKIERGERKARKEQVIQFAKVMKVDKEELITLWLADQIYDVIKGEDLASKAMDVAQQELKTKTKRSDKK